MISIYFLVTLFLIATCFFITIIKSKKINKTMSKASFFIYVDFIILNCMLYFLQYTFNIYHLITFIYIIFLLSSLIILKFFKLSNFRLEICILLFVIFLLQLGYISYTSYYTRQHDSRSFYNYENGGHFGYIGYIFFNNKLPDTSPIDYWCFYNPPLFYIISTIIIKIQTFFNFSIETAFENLQIISMCYTLLFDIYVYRILNKLNIKKSLIYMVMFVGFAPAMIIMSGSLNNDILSILLSTMAIFYTLKWYETDKLKDLIKIAITISLAIMTKISTALIAIAIAFVFISKIINNKKDIKKYIINFSIFALIALPIGLWFPIKNLILYDIPITYVQSVDEDHELNISYHSVFERFFTISSKEQLEDVNVIMEKDNADYNILISTIKSFIVDEQIDYSNNLILNISLHLIFYETFVILILFIINIIYLIKNYKKINSHWILFFGLILLLEIISYIKFCFDYPFTFTMNFRYIVPTLISYAALTGFACDNNTKLYKINTTFITLFSILSIIIFTNLI